MTMIEELIRDAIGYASEAETVGEHTTTDERQTDALTSIAKSLAAIAKILDNGNFTVTNYEGE